MRARAPAPALALATLATLASVAPSCALPADTLGTYDVVGTRLADGCGGAPNPWGFPVLLSRKNGMLSWNWLDASPILSGPVLDGDQAALSGQQIANVDADGSVMGPCDLSRADTLTVTLGSGSPPASFTAMLSYTFGVQEGANCTDQLASSGGPYEALPCTIRYSLRGTRE